MKSFEREFKSEQVPKPGPGSAKLPENWRHQLGNFPLELEIGCGAGLHPIRYALEHPDRHLIAIEQTHERFGKFERRIKNHPAMPNLLAVHANAISWVAHELPSEPILDRIWLLYPNPWPKAEHRNRRWHAMPFARALLTRLKPGGELILATNEKFYADEAEQDWLKWGELELHLSQEIDPKSHEPRTHFERKYLERGETCFDLVFQKRKRAET